MGLVGWSVGGVKSHTQSGKHAREREISRCNQRSSGYPHPLSFRINFSSLPLEGIRVRLSFEGGNPSRMRQLMRLPPD